MSDEQTTAQGVQETTSVSTETKVMAFRANSVKNPWLCPSGHLLGMIKREKVNGGSVSRLYLLRRAFYAIDMIPEPMIFAKVDAAVVSCSICGGTREWRPGADFLEKLQARKAR